MPDLWFWTALVIALCSTLVCLVAGLLRKPPNDVTLLAVAGVELFLLVYLVASIVRVVAGEPVARAGEFWAYLITALVIPLGAAYWALLERSRWSNFVLASVGLIIIVMMFRMQQIWYIAV